MMREPTWGHIWWRIKLLVRVNFSSLMRWLEARERVRRVRARKPTPIVLSDSEVAYAIRDVYKQARTPEAYRATPFVGAMRRGAASIPTGGYFDE